MKPILIFYINTDGYSGQQITVLVDDIVKNLSCDDSIKFYVVPITNGQHTKVECINPILATEEEYMVICKKLTEYTDKLMEKMNEKESK